MDTQTEIEEQAFAWLVRSDTGDFSAEEKQQFELWLAANTRHHVTFLRAKRAWGRADRLRNLRPLDGAIDEDFFDPAPAHAEEALKVDVEPVAGAFIGRRASRYAAFVTAVFAIAVCVWFAVPGSQWQSFETAVGSAERVLLQDGSTINLNTDSQIKIRFTAERREIILNRGEALFAVAKDLHRPFDVRADATTVRALGTAFSVRLRAAGAVEVLVSEGRVSVDSAKMQRVSSTLDAGEAATVRTQGIQVRQLRAEDVDRKLAWKDGRLWFDAQPLVEVVAEFNRYNRRTLAIADPAIEKIRIGGGFEAADLNNFIAALEKSFDIRAVMPQKGDADNAPILLVSAGRGQTP